MILNNDATMKKTATVTFLAVIALIVSLTALIFSVSIFTGVIPINSQINNQNATPTPTISPTNLLMTSTPKPTAPPPSTNVEPTKQPSPISTRLAILEITFSNRNIMTVLTASIMGNLTDQNGRGVTNATIILNAYANATQGWIKIGEGQTIQTINSGYFSIYVPTYVEQYSQIQAIYYGDLNYKPCNTTVEYSSIPSSYVVI